MQLNLTELRQARARLIDRRRELQDKFDETGNEGITEGAEFRRLGNDIEALDQRIEREEKMQADEAKLAHDHDRAGRGHSVGYDENGRDRKIQQVSYADLLQREESYCSFLEKRGIIQESSGYELNSSVYGKLPLGDLLAGYLRGPRGPHEKLVKRALDEGGVSSGEYLVPTILLGRWIDAIRAQTPTFSVGRAQLLPLETQTTDIATLEQDLEFVVVPENELIGDSDPVFGKRTLKVFKHAAICKFSFELEADAPNLAAMLDRSFTAAARLVFERLALAGLGLAASPPEPVGILYQEEVSEVGTVGLPDSYDEILDGCEKLWLANTQPNMVIMSPSNYRTYSGLKTGTELMPLPKPEAIRDLPFVQTSQMPSDSIVVGDFRDLIYGVRNELRILRLNERYAEYGQHALLGYFRFDVALSHAASFCKLTGVNLS